MKKLLYIVLDGLSDKPVPALDGKTPLETAIIPHLNHLAQKGKTGLMHTVKKGIAPESDVAVISLLGYDAHKYYTGRGPLESFAVGLKINDGDLAYRVNFATGGENGKIIDRRVGRNLSTEEATALAKSINEKVKLTSSLASFEFKNTIGHRGVLVIRSQNGPLCSSVTNTDPAYEKEGHFGVAKAVFEDIVQKAMPEKDSSCAKKAADLTNEFVQKSHEVLNDDPVNKKRISEGKKPGNLILTRDAGDCLPNFPPLPQTFKIKFGSLVEMPVEIGIAKLTGIDIIPVSLPTGLSEKDYPLRAKLVLEKMQEYDGLYIHLKGPDEPAHDGDCARKIKSIEAIDRFFFGELLPKINFKETIIAVTSDHSTPCILKAHSEDPVPLLIVGGNISSDNSSAFSEKACASGSIGEILGPELLPRLVGLIKK